jgi:MscS family membrane protein
MVCWLKPLFSPSLDAPFLGLQAWQWVSVVAFLLVGLAIQQAVAFIARPIGKALRLDRLQIDLRTMTSGRQAVGLLIALYIVESLVPALELKNHAEQAQNTLFWVLAGIAWTWLLNFLWELACVSIARKPGRMSERSEKLIMPFLRTVGRFVVLAGVWLYVLAALGVNVGAAVAGLGIGGIALAFAAKDTIENFFGAITVIFDMPFGIGDWVKVGAVEGSVEEINLRSTRIRTQEDSLVVIPNSNLIKASVENMGVRRKRRFSHTLSIGSESDAKQVAAFCSEAAEALHGHEGVFSEGLLVHVVGISDGNVNIQVICFLAVADPKSEAELKQALLLTLLSLAHSKGLRFSAVPPPPAATT